MTTESLILDERAVSEIEARANAATAVNEHTKRVRYDHGGGRMYNDAQDGGRDLVLDLYNESDRELYFHAREDIPALCATVKHLREREKTLIAVNSELIDGNHAAHVALDGTGIKREDVVWEGPIQHVTEYPVCDRVGFLQSQLEQLRAENERLKDPCVAAGYHVCGRLDHEHLTKGQL